MFTKEFTVSFDPQTFGLKRLQLDNDQLEEKFIEEEISLITDLSFFEEEVFVPIIENGIETKELFKMDSFGIGIYDFIKGCIKIIAMEENDFKATLRQYPHLISKEVLDNKMKLGKQILFKYCPECENKIF